MRERQLLEIRRQLVHSMGSIIAPAIVFLGLDAVKNFYGFFLIMVVVLNLYRQTRSGNKTFILEQFYIFEQWMEKQLTKYERGQEFLKGPILYFLGVFVTMSLFSAEQVIPAILILALADAGSTVVGIVFGKHKHVWNKSSSWEGTITFFLFAFGVLFYFAPLEIAIFIAGTVALIESLPKIDDNISIPLSVAFLLSVLV
jgi:dolichol kinase